MIVKNYWYYNKTRTVYDYELNYPIGKIEINESGNENKLDDDTYIISQIINIPLFSKRGNNTSSSILVLS
jgi:hypothetical protein